MNADEMKIIESSILPTGMEIDIDEGWRKLICNQFRGDPGRGFSELIQNFLDSYPSSTPWKKRVGKIDKGDYSISIIDYGEGMSRQRIRLLATIGGTDKKDDPAKIGTFGIGFFSIFNPKLGTKKVSVTTKCEGHSVEIVFNIEKPGERPLITTRVLDSDIPFSTKIDVEFDNTHSPEKCLMFAARSLRYYPCNVLINGNQYKSVWDEAKDKNAEFFKEGGCDGFIETNRLNHRVTLLCKYEYLSEMSPHYLASGNDMFGDLRDLHKRIVPFVPDIAATINSNALKVTISRDSYYLDYAYDTMVKALARVLLLRLGKLIDDNPKEDLIIANHYILRDRIREYLDIEEAYRGSRTGDEDEVIRKLAEAKVYRINGRKGEFSFVDIQRMLSRGVPLFFSPLRINLRWLGGNFRHDFVVLPSKCSIGGGAPDFYDCLFNALFNDVVNLDRISNDNEKIRRLAERGIVDREVLSPKCSIIGERKLSEPELKVKKDIDRILAHPEVKKVIDRHLYIQVESVQTVFFDVDADGATIATGLFDSEGRPVGHEVPDNMKGRELKSRDWNPAQSQKILLGLSRAHPFIRHLIESDDPYLAYYTLTFLAHEMALCQKLLVPYSPFFHLVKEKLAADMRKALMKQLAAEESAA